MSLITGLENLRSLVCHIGMKLTLAWIAALSPRMDVQADDHGGHFCGGKRSRC